MNMDLESLINAKLEGEITPEQHARLEALLRDDWQARRRYLELADQHARLLRQPEVSTGRLGQVSLISRKIRWQTYALVASAASIVLLAILAWPQQPTEKEATSDGVATISQTLDADFEGKSRRNGDTIAPGSLTLRKGLAQIEFFSGATLLVEGDAQIEIISAWEVRCHRGRVRVHVPPAAKGFLMHAPDVKLEDLGTEFALNVNGQDSAVHVFDGEVIAHKKDKAPASLKVGMTLASSTGKFSSQDFLPVGEMQDVIRQREKSRLQEWKSWAAGVSNDPRLISFYAFQHPSDDRWDRLVGNFAAPLDKKRAGGAVGAAWTQGRWPGKEALEFKRPGDRVRMNLDGTYAALTLACWVKVDSVDKKYNSLLLTDGYESGEPHWQIYEDGSLMFSIGYTSSGENRITMKNNQIYYSRPVVTADSLGRWHHLAVTYDNASGMVLQYFDGKEVGREVSALHQPGRPIVFGPCELGNWGLPTQGHQFPIRNLNGAIDEFAIYAAVLSGAEIRAIFANGKPE
jgi:hypothetical protein